MDEPEGQLEAVVDLEALFAAEAPLYDPRFNLAISARLARRRLIWDLAQGALTTVLVVLVLWALAPVLQSGLAPLAGPIGGVLLMLAPAAAVLLGVLMLIPSRAVVGASS